MAYRRLPNTDSARLLAIYKLNEMLSDDSSALKNHQKEIVYFKETFEKLIKYRETNKIKRRLLNAQKKELLAKLKVYVSHFLQVFNFAIDRGDINKECRMFFKLKTNTGIIPPLSKETDIIEWAYNIVDGEQKRIAKGVEVISHPKFTRIKEIVEETEKVIQDLKILDQLYDEYKIEITKKRIKVDFFIKQTWNDIEFQFISESVEIKRKKAAQFGVVYVGD